MKKRPMANPAPTRGKPKTPQQHKKLASLLAEGTPVGEALREAGWSELQSAKGYAAVPDAVFAKLPKKMQRLVELGKRTDRDTRKHVIRGRLLDNAIQGKDGGAMSAKILGSESELNMWIPDTQVGVIVLNAPQGLAERKAELLKDCELAPEEGQR
jgi:hypothetical protein